MWSSRFGLIGMLYLVMPIVAAGFGPQERALVHELAFYFVPWAIVILPYYAVTAHLKALWKFHYVFIAELAIMVVSIVVLLIWHGSVIDLPIAYGAGYLCGLLGLLVCRGLVRVRESGPSPNLALSMGNQYLANQMGSLSGLVDRYFQSFLMAGGISALGYVGQIVNSLSSLMTFREIYVVPLASEAGRSERLARMMSGIAFISVPCTAFVIAFAEPMVQVLFERGKFTAVDTTITAAVLQIMAVSLLFSSLLAPMVRLFQILDRIAYSHLLYLVLAARHGGAAISAGVPVSPRRLRHRLGDGRQQRGADAVRRDAGAALGHRAGLAGRAAQRGARRADRACRAGGVEGHLAAQPGADRADRRRRRLLGGRSRSAISPCGTGCAGSSGNSRSRQSPMFAEVMGAGACQRDSDAKARKFSRARARLSASRCGSGILPPACSTPRTRSAPLRVAASWQGMSKRRQISLILLSCTMPTNGTLKHRGQNETVEAHAADDVDVGECVDDRGRIGGGAADFNRRRAGPELLADGGEHLGVVRHGGALLKDEKDHAMAALLPKPDGVRECRDGGLRRPPASPSSRCTRVSRPVGLCDLSGVNERHAKTRSSVSRALVPAHCRSAASSRTRNSSQRAMMPRSSHRPVAVRRSPTPTPSAAIRTPKARARWQISHCSASDASPPLS